MAVLKAELVPPHDVVGERLPARLIAGLRFLGRRRRLTDPASALKTLHWGRNYLYVARLDTADGPVEVVVKQFRHRSARARLRRRLRGSKARKSWRVAWTLLEAGLLTPEPVMWIESTSLCSQR